MDAEVIDLAAWKAAHPRRPAVVVCWTFDGWWALWVGAWLRCWGLR